MTITPEQVKRLREKTGAGMMDCKRALEESGGDMEKAIEYLRKRGAATAERRADKMAKEGVIVTRVSADTRLGVMIEVNCETDFVSRSNDFTEFGRALAETVERHKPADVRRLLELRANGKTISELLNELLAKVGEKVEVRRFTVFESADGLVGAYTHMGNKIGVLVELTGARGRNDGGALSRDIAMQIAAMNPQYLRREDVPKETIDRELEIYRTQAANEGKAEQILGRIAGGRLDKFFQEVCLMEQTFIKDAAKTIREILGDGVMVRRFQRYHLGEN